MDLDADDLLLFARVVEAGSLSAAAERLRWPKSTVSRRLAGLEQRLGEKLLQRTTRQLNLTEFGQGVLEHARTIGSEVDSALALALHRQAQPSGRLRVSMPNDLAQQALGDMLARFVAEHPAVQLELDLSPRRVDLVSEGFDLAVRIGPLGEASGLTARRLALVEGGLFAAPNYLAARDEPQHPAALLQLHGLMILGRLGEPLPWQLQTPQGESWQGLPPARTLVNAPDMLLRLARAGLGVTAVGLAYAAPFLARGELVRVLPGWFLPPIPCWAVFPERRLMPLRTRLFIEAMVAELARYQDLDPGPNA